MRAPFSVPEAAVFCSLWRPLLRGTWWQLSVDNCLPWVNCCCEKLPHLYSRMDVVQVCAGFSQEAELWYVAPGCCWRKLLLNFVSKEKLFNSSAGFI